VTKIRTGTGLIFDGMGAPLNWFSVELLEKNIPVD
jgi:hypothetical protein